jgi:hypothetical protein
MKSYLHDAERATLAEIAHRLGRNALDELTAVARPETLLAWYRKLIAKKFDGSMYRKILRSSPNRRRNRAVGSTDGEGE